MGITSIAGCAIIKDNKIVLVRKKDKDVWEFPGGRVSNNSDYEETAISKTLSQIGSEPKIIQQFSPLEFQIDGKNMESVIFECDIDNDSDFSPGEKIEEIKWFNIKTLDKEKIGKDVKEIIEDV